MLQKEKLNMDGQDFSQINHKHKDSLIRIAFREKKDLLELYNAINGSDYKDEDEEDRCTIELADAFPKIEGLEPCLKCTATLLNINYGHNQEIMKRSKTLSDYSVFVQRIRNNQDAGMVLAHAVEKATDDCKKEGILKDILLKNRAEVKNMVLSTWGQRLI